MRFGTLFLFFLFTFGNSQVFQVSLLGGSFEKCLVTQRTRPPPFIAFQKVTVPLPRGNCNPKRL